MEVLIPSYYCLNYEVYEIPVAISPAKSYICALCIIFSRAREREGDRDE